MEEIGDESRRRIMDAAEELFAEQGFTRTSFVDIAERSGISRGSIPWHFANKDGLLVAVVERAIDRFLSAGSLTSSGEEGVQEVFERLKEWLHGPTAAMLYMILTEAMSTDGPVHEHYVEFFRNRRRAAALLLASTEAEEPSRAERAALDPIAAVVNGAIFGLGLQYQLDPTFDLDAAIDMLEALTEEAIGVARRRAVLPKKAPARRRQPRSAAAGS
jgi:TetR/AcrR family acrAB operon transcriptional repressor